MFKDKHKTVWPSIPEGMAIHSDSKKAEESWPYFPIYAKFTSFFFNFMIVSNVVIIQCHISQDLPFSAVSDFKINVERKMTNI